MFVNIFLMIRYISSSPIMQMAREGVSKLSLGTGMLAHVFEDDSGANSGKAEKATAEELMAPIERPHKMQKIE